MGNCCCSQREKRRESNMLPREDEQGEEEIVSRWELTARELQQAFRQLRRKVVVEAVQGVDGPSVAHWRAGDFPLYLTALEQSLPLVASVTNRSVSQRCSETQAAKDDLDSLKALSKEIETLWSSFPDRDWCTVVQTISGKADVFEDFEASRVALQSSHRQLQDKLLAKREEKEWAVQLAERLQRLASVSSDISVLNEEVFALIFLILQIIHLSAQALASIDCVKKLQADVQAATRSFESETETSTVEFSSEDIETSPNAAPQSTDSSVEAEDQYQSLISATKTQIGVLFSLANAPSIAVDQPTEVVSCLLTIEQILSARWKSNSNIEFVVLKYFQDRYSTREVLRKAAQFLRTVYVRREKEYLALVCEAFRLHPEPYNLTDMQNRRLSEAFFTAKQFLIRPASPSQWCASGGLVPLKNLLSLVTENRTMNFPVKTLVIGLCKPGNVTQLDYSRLVFLFAVTNAETESYALSKLHFQSPSQRLTPAELLTSLRNHSLELFLSDSNLLELLAAFSEEGLLQSKDFAKGLDLSWFAREVRKYSIPLVNYLRAVHQTSGFHRHSV